MNRLLIMLVSGIVLIASQAQAYIGPGAGAGTIAVILGILASVFFAVVAIVWYPFKRLLRRFKKSPPPDKASEADQNANEIDPDMRS